MKTNPTKHPLISENKYEACCLGINKKEREIIGHESKRKKKLSSWQNYGIPVISLNINSDNSRWAQSKWSNSFAMNICKPKCQRPGQWANI